MSAIVAAIFDVDGVVVDTPHERAWREAVAGFADPAGLTPDLYRRVVAGRPRLDGARAALAALGVAGADTAAPAYAARKQARFLELVELGAFHVFPDAPRCLSDLRAAGLKLAAASSSKNASRMLSLVPWNGGSLLDLFHADLCGRDVPAGKPDPALFLLAAAELGAPPAACLVAEDAPAGVEAARRGGMAALGVARGDDAAILEAAGADLVVATLDALDRAGLKLGRLRAN
jgi:beta-phosphoglucomutase